MKKILVVLILMIGFNLCLNAQSTCHFNLYRYKNNSVVIKFDCDKVEPFIINIKTESGEKVDNIYYKPELKEKTFFLTFNDQEKKVFIIDIEYSGVVYRFFYSKN